MDQTNNNLLYAIAAVLIVHGLGHAGGYWMLARSWAANSLAMSPLRWIFIGLWLAAALGFVAVGIGLLTHQSWWRSLAVISALLSLPSTILFFSFNINLVGALFVDVAVLVSLLWVRWPNPNVLGS